MPYYIAVYDVDQKRCGKMLKLFRRYLHWVQNSVFEGELTSAQFHKLRLEADKIMKEKDAVIFYELPLVKYLKRSVMGEEKQSTERMI